VLNENIYPDVTGKFRNELLRIRGFTSMRYINLRWHRHYVDILHWFNETCRADECRVYSTNQCGVYRCQKRRRSHKRA